MSAQLLAYANAVLPILVLCVLRIGAAMAFLPAFGERAVPVRIKIALVFALTFLVLPTLLVGDPPSLAKNADWVLAGAAEICTGLFLGFSFRMMVYALQVAGSIAAQSTSLAQIFGGGVTPDPQPALGNVLLMAALALAALSGLHLRLTEAFMLSFQVFPLGVFPTPSRLGQAAIADVSRMFVAGFTLSAPFVVSAMLYNLALGVINRAMPQLMVAFVGAPALTLGGLGLAAIAIPFLMITWSDLFEASLWAPFGVSR